MPSFINQYNLLFFLSWLTFYLIFPAWALPISVIGRAVVFITLLIYFILSACLMNRWFKEFSIDKPLIDNSASLKDIVKENLWLVTICCIAVVLHIKQLSYPILILGDETIHLQSGLWVYEYLDVSWHKIFQTVLWILIALALIIVSIRGWLVNNFSGIKNNKFIKSVIVILFSGFLIFWFFLLKDITYYQTLIRYPPVSKILYFLAYSTFGIDRVVPRAVQLVFYLLCAIYLYRTIKLFYGKETALIGAVLYLFLPITFAYAHLGELASGTIFFILACSFYFLRFVKEEDKRDMLLAAYLIGIGCLYKKLNLILFIVCFTFIVVYKIRKRDFHSLIHLKILLISLVPIIPWVILTKYFSWRNYVFQWSNLNSLDSKIVNYITLLPTNLSVIVFALLVAAVFYVSFYKRNVLTVFFWLLFIVYYFFIVSDMGGLSPRFSMAFYPTIIVFLSLFIARIIQTIKWKHAFKFSFAVITIYLIIISAVSPFNDRFLNIMNMKLMYFPSEQAMSWIKDNVQSGEKIITVRIMSYNFYRVKYGIKKNKIIGFWYSTRDISTPEKLRELSRKNKASYIMFPYSPDYPYSQNSAILQYLKDNRDEEFIEAAEFKNEDNYIYVYKLKNI